MKKRITFFGFIAILSIGCMPRDLYKQKYPQQDISYGFSAPYSFSKSEQYATENQKPIPVNSQTPAEETISPERKPITQTMKFIGQEEHNSDVAVVSRKNKE